jgi:DNA polymerase-3 subunit epsilon
MEDRALAFIDTETTGLDPTRHEVIEIGCVIAVVQPVLLGIPTLTIQKELNIKIIPEHIETADPGALRVNGYNTRDWSDAIPLQQAMETLTSTLQGSIFIAQNVSFDWSFLVNAAGKTKVPLDRAVFYAKLDLGSIARGKFAGQSVAPAKYTLRGLCEHFGIKNEQAHTALSDAKAAFEIYKRLLHS